MITNNQQNKYREILLDLTGIKDTAGVLNLLNNELQKNQYYENDCLRVLFSGRQNIADDVNLNRIQKALFDAFPSVLIEKNIVYYFDPEQFRYDHSIFAELVHNVSVTDGLSTAEKAELLHITFNALKGGDLL